MTDPYPDDWSYRSQQVKQRDNWKCRNCGRAGGPRGDHELHAHHIVPVARYGSHHVDNLVTLCEQCHDAVHGQGDAPTVPLDKRLMPDNEFIRFKRLMHEVVEAWYDEDDELWRPPTKNVDMDRYGD